MYVVRPSEPKPASDMVPGTPASAGSSSVVVTGADTAGNMITAVNIRVSSTAKTSATDLVMRATLRRGKGRAG
jgi:hypothetical protein